RARSLLRRKTFRDRPRADLVLPHGEERDEAEQLVRRMDDAIERGLVQAKVRAERRGLGRFELRDLRLELRAHPNYRHRAMLRGRLAQRPEHGVRVADVAFVEIRDDELRQE